MFVIFPQVLKRDAAVSQNPIRQLAQPITKIEGTIARFTMDRFRGHLFTPKTGGDEVFIVTKVPRSLEGNPRVLRAAIGQSAEQADLSSGAWLRHPLLPQGPQRNVQHDFDDVIASWENAFAYIAE